MFFYPPYTYRITYPSLSVWVRFFIGIVLCVAAILKLHVNEQFSASTANGSPLFYSVFARRLIAGTEAVIGIWMAGGLLTRYSRIAGMALLGIYLLFAISFTVRGEPTCGCFGNAFAIRPAYMAAFDLIAIVALIPVAPSQHFAPHRRRVWTTGILAASFVSILLFQVAHGAEKSLTDPLNSWKVPAAGSLVVLEPDKWVGGEFPLFDYIVCNVHLQMGQWTVVFVHHDCSFCANELNRYLASTANPTMATELRSLVVVEVPAYGAMAEFSELHGRGAEIGRLNEDRDWFIQTPVVVHLVNGRVTDVIHPT